MVVLLSKGREGIMSKGDFYSDYSASWSSLLAVRVSSIFLKALRDSMFELSCCLCSSPRFLMIFIMRSAQFLTTKFILSFLASCSQSKPQLPDKPISGVPGNCFLDAQKRDGPTIRLDGWAYGNLQESPLGIAIKVDAPNLNRTYYTQQLVSRPDVAAEFKSQSLLKTGFTISMPSTESPAGAKISMISEGANENHVCRNSFILK